ncbi:MAG: alpha/beta hydrolase [Actinomycetota bacterium]|nr:alpha/beta hydrolase [Candidatus Dormibacteraeota bacterium]MDQ6945455.1 alpha/beta hydrolase [Actinomycetota bacterium]
MVGYGDDVAAALDELGVARAGVVGWSVGGRVALALAARRPDLVQAAAVVATPAPDEEVPRIDDQYRAMVRPLRADPARATARLAPLFAGVASEPAAALAAGPADEAIIASDTGRRAALETMMEEAFRQDSIGLAADIVSYTVVPWGFEPADVTCRTILFYGAADPIVGVAHGEWYAARICGAQLRVVPESGHLVALSVWADILAAVSR